MAGRVVVGCSEVSMGLSSGEKPRDAPPAYARRPIENIRTPVMQGSYRGSGLVRWRKSSDVSHFANVRFGTATVPESVTAMAAQSGRL